jgi:DNA-binding beta-propeller fold protein YncE
VSKYDENGRLLYSWGTQGEGFPGPSPPCTERIGSRCAFPGALNAPHGISVDQEGNVYIANSYNNARGVEKYIPKKNADKNKLMGRQYGFDR